MNYTPILPQNLLCSKSNLGKDFYFRVTVGDSCIKLSGLVKTGVPCPNFNQSPTPNCATY